MNNTTKILTLEFGIALNIAIIALITITVAIAIWKDINTGVSMILGACYGLTMFLSPFSIKVLYDEIIQIKKEAKK